ncbi:isoprenoid synthase domain-containing protein [Aspergillus cavernicola]|uniref:(2E,6E)-farnesyl diphosphate synthase n=1 Tax=Aspergillus cavernicola TaxID=176166 RepID=A0ABR4HUI7_9EURO
MPSTMEPFDALNAPQPYQQHYPPRWNVHHLPLPQTNGHSIQQTPPIVKSYDNCSGGQRAVTNGADAQHQRKAMEEEIISAPHHYITGLPGKDIRGKLISAFNEWFQIPDEQLEIIKRVVGLLHVASLLIDDIEDSSNLRRGFPVAHSIFGIPQTINSANYAYFQAQSEVLKLRQCEAFNIFTEELLRLHRGQGMDLYWRDSLTCPSEEEYLEMVANKTGGLFRLAIKLIQLESEVDEDCVPLVDLLGIIFQIRDDYENLQSEQYAKNKGFAEDITEGKFSYPIVHSIRSSPGSGSGSSFELVNILRQKTDDEAVKRYTIRILEKTGSFEYTRQKLRDLIARARGMLAGFVERGTAGGAAGLGTILDFLELKD